MIWVKDSPRALPVASLVAIALFGSVGCSHKAPPPPINAAVVFAKKCGSCHFEGNDLRAPEPTALRNMSRAAILTALQSGRMRWQGKNLSSAEKSAVAEFLGKSDLAVAASLNGVCARDLDPPAHPPEWSGWGVTPTATRLPQCAPGSHSAAPIPGLHATVSNRPPAQRDRRSVAAHPLLRRVAPSHAARYRSPPAR